MAFAEQIWPAGDQLKSLLLTPKVSAELWEIVPMFFCGRRSCGFKKMASRFKKVAETLLYVENLYMCIPFPYPSSVMI